MKPSRFLAALVAGGAVGLPAFLGAEDLTSQAATTTQGPATQPLPDRTAALVDAIRQAPDPSAIVQAYSNAKAVDPYNAAVEQAYVRRMVDLGLPEMAEAQAQNVLRTIPEDGLAWAVTAYVSAKRNQMDLAGTNLLSAVRFAPDDPFVQRTAGQLTAWADTRPDKTQIPGSMKTAIDTVRKQFSGKPEYVDAYQDATQTYRELAAAPSTAQPTQPAQTAQSPDVATNYPAAPPAYYPVETYPSYPVTTYPAPYYTTDYPYWWPGPSYVGSWWWWPSASFIVVNDNFKHGHRHDGHFKHGDFKHSRSFHGKSGHGDFKHGSSSFRHGDFKQGQGSFNRGDFRRGGSVQSGNAFVGRGRNGGSDWRNWSTSSSPRRSVAVGGDPMRSRSFDGSRGPAAVRSSVASPSRTRPMQQVDAAARTQRQAANVRSLAAPARTSAAPARTSAAPARASASAGRSAASSSSGRAPVNVGRAAWMGHSAAGIAQATRGNVTVRSSPSVSRGSAMSGVSRGSAGRSMGNAVRSGGGGGGRSTSAVSRGGGGGGRSMSAVSRGGGGGGRSMGVAGRGGGGGGRGR